MERKKVGLALSGGAARGFAHLGVAKVLSEHKIPIDFIAGTSAGSFAGAAMASGLSVEEIIKMSRKISWYSMTGFSFSPMGLLSNASMGAFIKEHLPVKRFEDLPTPFAAIACDLETGEEVVLKDAGDLAAAIRASCAIPGVFVPVEIHRRKLIDGGVISHVPTKAVKKLGAEIIIAVDVIASGATYWGTPSTLLGVFFQSAMMLLRSASKAHHYRADVVIIPELAHLRPDEMSKINEFIEAGEAAALEKIDEIKTLIFGLDISA
ncbi:MAG: patatin-like phospholipase family protein [Acidobacteria bacterium]|jgi:NTE family protein|nr:patatin-like phospholipase family protein [Acidobacteriota bacterium]